MVKVKVRVLDAVVDGMGRDSLISIDEQSVDALVKLGYVEVVKEDKQKSVARSVDTEEDSTEEKAVEEVKESAPKTTSKTRKTSSRAKK